MSFTDQLYDLLFEISSEERHKILVQLSNESLNLTNLSQKISLNLPETRRHISRLQEVKLINRNPDSSYSLTNFGKIILEQINEISFFTSNNTYFQKHTVEKIPREFKNRLGELSNSKFEDNILNYIRILENVIKEAKKEVLLLVDQFPLNHLSLIIDAIERGVHFKIIEPINRLVNPDLDALAHEESQALTRMKFTPLVDQRMLSEVDVFLCLSETYCVTSFPTLEGKNDYIGFISTDEKTHKWGRDIFEYYWKISDPRQRIKPILKKEKSEQILYKDKHNQIIIVGKNRPEFDVKTIQDAVDNFDQVILKGIFDLGVSTITIKTSVHIKGEGRDNNIPKTKIFKKGWDFPFLSQEFLFMIRGEKIDVIIENIHFENFNGTCIGTHQGNSMEIRKNRITLESGLGRGLTFGHWGDFVVGITAGGDDNGGFKGGIIIEDNFLDFARSYPRGGFISHDGRARDPSFRPNLQNHGAPVCVGMNICRNLGKVIVRNNVIKNMNSRGILVFDNWSSSEIIIEKNIITSDVFGAYPFNSPLAGVGILVQSSWTQPRSGTRVLVSRNKINLSKINYCGIVVHGPAMYEKGAGKLGECIISENDIMLDDGYIGVQIRKNDYTTVENNRLSGKVYYGLQISGNKDRDKIDLAACENIFQNNDLSDLVVKKPDKYSDTNVNGYWFTGDEKRAKTAHIWLNPFSYRNKIHLLPEYAIIDEGKGNIIIIS